MIHISGYSQHNKRFFNGLFRYQTENAISTCIARNGLTSLGLFGHELNVEKVSYKWNIDDWL